MGFAVNASTFGMAIAGIAVALFGRNIDRRNGIWISLAVLAIPTTLLSMTDDITIFALLRVAQGLCMSTAFTLTVAYLAEHFSPAQATGALGRLCDRQCRQQFLRPHHVGGRRRHVRHLDQLPDLRRAQYRRRAARLADAQEDRAHDGDGRLDARDAQLDRALQAIASCATPSRSAS